MWALLSLSLVAVIGFFAVAHLEENDEFCASCHSEPESTYYQRTQASQPIDLASVHALLAKQGTQHPNTRCIDCHAGPGFTGRLSAMTLGAQDAIKWVSGTAIQPAITTQPLGDAHCLKCHTDTPQASNFDRHFHRTLARWQQADANAGRCISCHTSHTTDGNATIGFLQQQRLLVECKRCHVALGVEQ
ncbi:MAG: hypothetical protein HC853_02555 [Anaerolineae bacterium]|nr:hypothetical protein [Anaerolineae bacterium]